jgi:PAS domain S-box-containing protein
MKNQAVSSFEVLSSISWGTHFCQFYEAKEDLLEILVPYIQTGLANNEYCLCVISRLGPVSPDDLRSSLLEFTPGFERQVADKDVEILYETDWYLQGNQFNSSKALTALNEKYEHALGSGYSGMRVWTDASWLSDKHWSEFDIYERQIDDLVTSSRMIILGTYPVTRISAAKILDVVNMHRFAIRRRMGNWEMIETTTEAQSRARLIVDTIPTMAWTLQRDGVVDFVNKRWIEYTGHPLRNLEDPLRVMHPDDIPRVMDKWKTTVISGTAQEDELRLLRHDGEYRWFLVRTAPLIDEQGNIVNWYGVAIDIDDSKRLSNALLESEKRYTSLFENMKEGVAYFKLHYEGETLVDATYLEVNPAWELLTGFTGVVGRKLTDLLPGALITGSELISRASKVALTGKSDKFETYSAWLKKWLSVAAYCPKREHVIVVLDNITERREAEEKLQIAYKSLSYHVDNTPLAVIEFDKDLFIKRWSRRAEELFGWTASEVLGRNVYDEDLAWIYKEDATNVDEINKELRNGAVDWNQSHNRNNTKYGKVVSCEWYNSVLKDDQGNVKAILSLVLDVTERSKTEQKLQRVNAELHSLSSHLQNVRELERTAVAREIHDELGQQLTGLKIDALWVARKLEGGDKSVRDKVVDMVALINDTMKAVRRISTQLRPGILDDLGLIAALEWQSQEFEKRTGISSLFTSSDYDLTLEAGLATNIFRVYQEALTNIARHANATSIETVVIASKDHLILTIKDNGQGFDPTQAKETSFGLIGMKERALMMGGQLIINSAKQEGTRVTLRVPIDKAEKEDQ